MTVAIIADIVRSRGLPDRSAAQRALEGAIARVEADYPHADAPMRPTVGDELQSRYPDLSSAVTAVILVRLALPDGVVCRFGLGWGAVRDVASRTSDALQDGPGWWAAREAIEAVERMERARISRARMRVCVADAEGADAQTLGAAMNAYLLVGDHLLDGMNARVRRLAYGAWRRVPQKTMAEQEGITQSAVSQALSRSGATALLAGIQELAATAGAP